MKTKDLLLTCTEFCLLHKASETVLLQFRNNFIRVSEEPEAKTLLTLEEWQSRFDNFINNK